MTCKTKKLHVLLQEYNALLAAAETWQNYTVIALRFFTITYANPSISLSKIKFDFGFPQQLSISK
jgi:hypothetical protein